MQIEDRITFARPAPVTARQIDKNIASVSQNLRPKSAVFLNVPSECVLGHESKTLSLNFADLSNSRDIFDFARRRVRIMALLFAARVSAPITL